MAWAGPRTGHRADDLTTELNVDPETPSSAQSRWGVFGNPAFVVILVATSLSSVGLAMFDTASAWQMTSLDPSPRLVSAVQVATTLPLFLLTLPAGALSDVVDPRRLLIVAQVGIVAVSIAFAMVVSARLAGPTSLLATSFLLGIGGALSAPAWLLITPMLVPRPELDSAIALIFALILSLPVLLYELYGFLLPAFSPEQQRVATPLMLAIPFLFVAGVLFGYFVVLPAAVRFFQNFNSGQFNVLVQASQYYHFAAVILLAMGLVFQVPVAILAATRAGVVSTAQLRHNRRYAIPDPPDRETTIARCETAVR